MYQIQEYTNKQASKHIDKNTRKFDTYNPQEKYIMRAAYKVIELSNATTDHRYSKM